MTPAEELRQAAHTIRERAATLVEPAVPWFDTDAAGQVLDTNRNPRGGWWEHDADHIATWSPAVAFAVAAWLDVTADGVEVVDEIAAARGFVTHHRRTGEEWTLARLINGSAP